MTYAISVHKFVRDGCAASDAAEQYSPALAAGAGAGAGAGGAGAGVVPLCPMHVPKSQPKTNGPSPAISKEQPMLQKNNYIYGRMEIKNKKIIIF